MQTTGKLKYYITGFCLIIDAYVDHIKGRFEYTELEEEFPEFYKYIENRRSVNCGRYYFSSSSERAKVSREFLKSEYGIEVK